MVSLILYDRKRLFGLINILPTIFQVVTDNKPIKGNPTMDSGSKFRGSTEVSVFLYLVILDSSMLKFHRIKVIIKVNISMPLLFFKKKYDCFCLTNKTTGSSSSKWAYWNILWKLWWKLQQRWILDRLWYLWVVVPWKVYYDDPYKGWDPKAL